MKHWKIIPGQEYALSDKSHFEGSVEQLRRVLVTSVMPKWVRKFKGGCETVDGHGPRPEGAKRRWYVTVQKSGTGLHASNDWHPGTFDVDSRDIVMPWPDYVQALKHEAEARRVEDERRAALRKQWGDLVPVLRDVGIRVRRSDCDEELLPVKLDYEQANVLFTEMAKRRELLHGGPKA